MNRNIRLILNFLIAPLAVPIVLLLTIEPSWAANHYVREAATGSNNGSDWTNACTDFTGSCDDDLLVRGDTYYVATGTYNRTQTNDAHRWQPAVSGTQVITVKGATAADHGTDTGWVASYGVDVTQASFEFYNTGTFGMSLQTSYFVLDGVVGSGSNPSSYGFLCKPPPSATTNQTPGCVFVGILSSTTTTTNVQVKHMAYVGTDATVNDIAANAFQICGNPGNCDTITLANNYSEKTVKFLQASSMANSTIEYNFVKSVGANFSAHSELISLNNCHSNDGGLCAGHTTQCTQGECSSNNVVRYNWFGGVLGASVTGGIVALDGNAKGWKDGRIYGNVFIDCGGGNGCIATGTSGGVAMGPGLKVYNNTFATSPATPFWQCGAPTPCAAISAGGNEWKNNIHWSSRAQPNDGTGFGGPTVIRDYNSYLSTTGTPPTEPNGQIASFDPFVSSAAKNWYLANGTSVSAGVSLGPPYNTDVSGRTRGTDGKWDRGAFEFNLPAPAAPQNLRVVP